MQTLEDLRKHCEGFVDRVGGYISRKPPEWTLKDGKDLKLRELKSEIRNELTEGLEEYGVVVGEEVIAGIDEGGKLTGIVRGHLDSCRKGQIYVDETQSVSIENFRPAQNKDFENKQHRERIIYPPEFDIPPFIIITLQSGEEYTEGFADLEIDLISTLEALNYYDFIKLEPGQAEDFLSKYSEMRQS